MLETSTRGYYWSPGQYERPLPNTCLSVSPTSKGDFFESP
jgi:hypothetical protein